MFVVLPDDTAIPIYCNLWREYTLKNWKKYLCGSDIHGNLQDKKAVEAFFKFADQWRPDIRIVGGDVWDFAPLRGKADEYERKQSMREDVEAGKEFLIRFKPHKLLKGNHDLRLWKLAERADGIILDYAQAAIADLEKLFKQLKCDVFEYEKRNGILQIGDLKFCHGYSQGLFAARQHALAYGDIIFGHVHQIQQYTVPGFPKSKTAYCCGCLCDLNMQYASAQIGSLAHRHGWAYGAINEKTGEHITWIAEEVGGKWLIPSDM